MPINNSQPYGGPYNIYMGNGDSMSISHTSNLPLSLGSSTFTLQMYSIFHQFVKIFYLLLVSLKIIMFSFSLHLTSIKSIAYALDVYCFKAFIKMVYIHLICQASLLLHKPLLPFTPLSGIIVWVIRHQMSLHV
jgi:NADH:ubiquinone oxidoreductase subunit K